MAVVSEQVPEGTFLFIISTNFFLSRNYKGSSTSRCCPRPCPHRRQSPLPRQSRRSRQKRNQIRPQRSPPPAASPGLTSRRQRYPQQSGRVGQRPQGSCYRRWCRDSSTCGRGCDVPVVEEVLATPFGEVEEGEGNGEVC
jgi:hypothetical protein